MYLSINLPGRCLMLYTHLQDMGSTSLAFGTKSLIWFFSSAIISSSIALVHLDLYDAYLNVSGSFTTITSDIAALICLGFGFRILTNLLSCNYKVGTFTWVDITSSIGYWSTTIFQDLIVTFCSTLSSLNESSSSS